MAIAFALLGGILLNLMPCVFPVLGIKVMGFVEHAHGDARAMRLQGWIFAAGVVVSFLRWRASCSRCARAARSSAGASSSSRPLVVALLAALFFVLALNLFGVFEWGLFAQSMTSNVSARGRYADAFLAGVLATVVATPCTAPFMGAAVGFTLAQPARRLARGVRGAGRGHGVAGAAALALPRAAKRLPKPGRVDGDLQAGDGLPALRHRRVAGVGAGRAGRQRRGAGAADRAGRSSPSRAWIYGRWAHSGSRAPRVRRALRRARRLRRVARPRGAHAAGVPVAKAGELPWQAWSPEKVAELTAAGKPVFVDFTAAWCVTCQVNKRVALNNAGVVDAFAPRASSRSRPTGPTTTRASRSAAGARPQRHSRSTRSTCRARRSRACCPKCSPLARARRDREAARGAAAKTAITQR